MLTPHRFIHAVKRADERFRSYMHQDAQEFLNFLLDTLLETVTALERPPTTNGGASQASSEGSTFIHELFCGKTVSQTRCMNCENCSQREEQVMEFTLEIDRPDTTLLRCLCAYRCAPVEPSGTASRTAGLRRHTHAPRLLDRVRLLVTQHTAWAPSRGLNGAGFEALARGRQ